MALDKKTMSIVGLAAVLLVSGIAYALIKKEALIPSIQQFIQLGGRREASPPRATGKIDDVGNALKLELSIEESAAAGEKTDSDAIIGDSQEISNFGQSYNESDL